MFFLKRLFSGGVHPNGKKELTCYKDLLPVLDPEQVIISLRQHIGAPCSPLVNVGEYVRVGQKIGDGEGLCVPVHASVSGVVTEIGPRPHPGGGMVPAITILNDHQEKMAEDLTVCPDPEELTPEELFQIIREAGIVGMGGAAFPTEVKAASGLNKIDTLIINACECEPYITADDALLQTQPVRVLRGVRLLVDALKPGKTVLAIEDNKPGAIAVLRERLAEFPGVEVQVLPTRYPQGAEKQLVRSITGREVPPGKLPVNAGCAVFNASTAAAISQAVYDGLPLIRRIVTVTGEGVEHPQNFLVPIGTPLSALLEAAGGLREDVDKVISGGPMMGTAQETLEVPVIKGTNAVLCLPKQGQVEEPKCIRCGKCVAVCPMNLQPLYLYRYEQSQDLDALGRFHLMDCMECGCCAYACPGKLPLVEHFRAGKRALKEGNVLCS